MEESLIYREHGKIYHADSCEPLLKAWKNQQVQLEAWARLTYPGYPLNETVLPGVNSIGYWDAHYPQEWGLDWHRNEGIEITFLEKGSHEFTMEQGSYTLLPDDLTITRPWQPHKLGNPNIGAGKLFWLILDVGVRYPHQEWNWPSWVMLTKKDLEELTKRLRQNEQPIWKATAELRNCIRNICRLIEDNDAVSTESRAVIYINELLLSLLNMFRQGAFSYDAELTESVRTVELFIRVLKDNLLEPWTLEQMAEHCKLGVTRFVHYFKQLTNMTPMVYLNFIRLEAAASELVKHPQKNINQICYECGFSSSQYFATVFKKQYGCSPAAYRAQGNQIQETAKAICPYNGETLGN